MSWSALPPNVIGKIASVYRPSVTVYVIPEGEYFKVGTETDPPSSRPHMIGLYYGGSEGKKKAISDAKKHARKLARQRQVKEPVMSTYGNVTQFKVNLPSLNLAALKRTSQQYRGLQNEQRVIPPAPRRTTRQQRSR